MSGGQDWAHDEIIVSCTGCEGAPMAKPMQPNTTEVFQTDMHDADTQTIAERVIDLQRQARDSAALRLLAGEVEELAEDYRQIKQLICDMCCPQCGGAIGMRDYCVCGWTKGA